MYENTTYDVILERMLERVSDKYDKREGSLVYDAHSPAAIEFQILYLELEQILSDAYGDTATREFLVKRCAERGIYPYESTHAVLKGTFTPAKIDMTGQRFNIGSINYSVTEKISDGIYKVQCAEPGVIGNQQLGTMIPIEYIPGLETAELTEILVPGEDEEDTEDLRKRYFNSFSETPFGGNVADYLKKTNEIAGVGSTKVTRCWNGDISPSDLIPSDTVKAWYESIKDTLDNETAAWLTAVYTAAAERKLTTGGTVLLTITDSNYNAANETLIDSVQKIIDPKDSSGEGYGIAPIGHEVTVKSAVPVEIAVRTNVTFSAGYSWENLSDSISSAVSAYLLELRKEWADSSYLIVRISQIETRLLSVEGIIDVSDTTINGNSENAVLGEYEIPVLGGVQEC